MPGVAKGKVANKAKQPQPKRPAAASKPPLPASKKRKRQLAAPPPSQEEEEEPEEDEEVKEDDEELEGDTDGSIDTALTVKKEEKQAEDDNGVGSSREQQIELDEDNDEDDDVSLSSSDEEQDALLKEEEAQDPNAPFDELALPLRIYIGTYTGSLYALESLHSLHHLLTSPPLPPTSQHTTTTTATTPTTATHRPSIASAFYTLFNTDAHRASIHAVAASPDGSHVVSSGVDEVVQLYRLQGERRHVGSLHRHYASVNQLLFPSPHTFLSASDDGTVAVFASTHQWEMVKRLSATGAGSSARVLSMSLHPSHRALLTSSSDGVVRMWDMVRGVEATRRRTKSEQTSVMAGGSGQVREEVRVEWEEDGHGYVMVRGRTLTVYDEQGAIQRVVHADTRILSSRFIAPSLLVAGCEDCSLRCWDGRTGEQLWIQRHHAARIRCLDYLRLADQRLLLVSASTDGQVCVWRASGGGGGGGDGGGVRVGVERVCGAKSEAQITALCCGVKWDGRRPARVSSAVVATVQMEAEGDEAEGEEKATVAGEHGDARENVRGASATARRSEQEGTAAAKRKQKQTQKQHNGDKRGQVRGQQRSSKAHVRENDVAANNEGTAANRRLKGGITIVNNKRRAR